MAADPTPSSRSFDVAFNATRWSLVVALREAQGDRHPLAELTQSYSYPVYAYLRRRGHDPASASRLMLGFFAHLGAELEQGDPSTFGRFRAFLLDRLQAFADRPDAGDVAVVLPPAGIDFSELERRVQDEPIGAGEPEAVFARGFALQVLARGKAQLREEARRSEREPMFDLLEPYLTREPRPERVLQLAAQLGIGSLAVQIAVKRLRQRFRQLVEAELQETVSSPADLEAERAALHQILAGAR